jgi:hypothetical protein
MIATARDDVYAFHRTMGGIEKISFHTSGICRRAFTEQYGAPEGMADRVILRWNRAQIAPAGSNTLTRLLSVSFSTSHLSTAAVPANKPVLWLAAAPPGRSRSLAAAVTQEPAAPLSNGVAPGRRRVAWCARRPSPRRSRGDARKAGRGKRPAYKDHSASFLGAISGARASTSCDVREHDGT